MPIPTVVTDLSTVAASNSPAGSDSPTDGDNYIRALSAIIRQEHDAFAGSAAGTAAQGAGAIFYNTAATYATATIGAALVSLAAFDTSLAASGGSALVGFLQAGTGGVLRTAQTKMRELISSEDFNNTRGANNLGFGNNAIDSMAPAGGGTAEQNIGIGTDSLTACTEGFGNTAVGYRTLRTLTTPAYCSAFGIRALENANWTGGASLACTGLGAYALNANTDGQYNVGVGYLAGTLNTTGFFNVWVGTNSGATNVTGTNNTGLGHATLNLATGSRNVALGAFALTAQTTGNDTVGIGHQALFANQSGVASVGIGSNAFASATTGPNVGIGHLAGQSIQTGANNVVLSPAGGLATASGASSRNIAIGTNTLNLLTTNSDCVAVGHEALKATVSGQCTAVGNFALTALSNGGGTGSVGVGYNAGSGITTGTNNVCIGAASGTDAVRTITTNSNEIVMGNNAHTDAFIKVAWTVTSDARDKTDHADLQMGLDCVTAMRPKSFKLMDRVTGQATTGTRFGFFAQDVLGIESANQVLVDATDPENLKMRESMIVPILVKALQEMNATLSVLRAEFDEYKAAH